MNGAVELAIQACQLVLLLSLPPIVVASVVGLLVSLFQAVTQLQEQTLSFGVKLVSVVCTIIIIGGWLAGELMKFSQGIFDDFYIMVR